MPKRNRHREATKGLVSPKFQVEHEPLAPQGAEAAAELNGLVKWLQANVHYIYQKGGLDGQPVQRRFSEPVFWVPPSIDDTISWTAHSTSYFPRAFSKTAIETDSPKDAAANKACGYNFAIDNRLETRSGLSLLIAANGEIHGGRYNADGIEPPVPNAVWVNFGDAIEASEQGVALEAAAILTQFRKAVTYGPAPRIDGVTIMNHDLTATAPPELW